MTLRKPRIAVTGFGAVTGLAGDAAGSFRALVLGETAIHPVSDLMHRCATVPCVAQAPEQACVAEPGARHDGDVSWSCSLAWRAAFEAIERADLGKRQFEIVLGASTGATREGIAECAELKDGSVNPLVRRLVDEPIGALGHRLVKLLPGAVRSTVLCSACSSGALSIAIGVMRLEQGAHLPQIVGGTDSLNLLTLSGFESLGALARGACQPFDESRNGLTLGEGAAFLVLETDAMVLSRGAKVFGWLDGYAVGAEAHHLTHPEADGGRAGALIREAMQRAGISSRDVGYVNAHGTATLANDAMECRALRDAMGVSIDEIPVSSSKGQIGHTLAAAGAIEAVFALQAILAQTVPPTGGLSKPATECDLRHVLKTGIRANIQVALSTSFGFGGSCAVLALSDANVRRERVGVHADIEQPLLQVVNRLEDGDVWVSGLCTLGPEGIRRGEEIVTWHRERRGDTRCELPFEPLDLLVMERSRRFDRLTGLSALGCSLALEEAGIGAGSGSDPGSKSRVPMVGLVLGNALGPVGRSAQFVQRILSRGPKGANPAEFPHLLPSSVSGNASIYASLRGPVFNVSDVGATIQAALELGIDCLLGETADAMLVGTTECRDEGVLCAQSASSAWHVASSDGNDGSAWLVIEQRAAAAKRGAKGCLLVASGWLVDLARRPFRLPRPVQRESVILSACDTMSDEQLDVLGWAGEVRRQCSARAFDGWSHAGFVLAAGAAMVTAGECPSCLVITDSPRGPHVACFSRAPHSLHCVV